MKFGQLILRKVIQIVAARCHILRLKMHQIRFRLGLRPRPAGGAYSAPLAGFKGGLLLGDGRAKKRKGGKGKKGGKRKGGGKEGKEGEEKEKE